MHDLSGFRAVFLHVGTIARQLVEHFRRHTPQPGRCGLHDPTDIPLSLGDDIDERLAVQAQRHRPTQIAVVEGRFITVDEQVAVDAARSQLADRLW